MRDGYSERSVGTRVIRVERRHTPRDFRDDRSSYLGSAFSIEPTLLQSASLRPHAPSEHVTRLFLVGAGRHSAAGLPGVLLSAKITSRLVQERLPRSASASPLPRLPAYA
ncbi:MAG: hypothetical protein M3336_09350 [Chloroflexota bacterium]|nr:hypothetical protein [Chloroflexota bacterium]